MDIRGRLRAFIESELLFDRGGISLREDTPLLEDGIIDSLGLMKLVAFIDSEFGVSVKDEELIPENFATLEALERYTMTKLHEGKQA